MGLGKRKRTQRCALHRGKRDGWPSDATREPVSVHSRAKDSGLTPAYCGPSDGGDIFKKGRTVYEAPAIIGTCINCIAPGSLLATFALILIGVGLAAHFEMRKKGSPRKCQMTT